MNESVVEKEKELCRSIATIAKDLPFDKSFVKKYDTTDSNI